MHIDKIYSQQKATKMLRGKHSTRPLEGIYQVKMFGVHTKLKEGGSGGRVINNFRVRKTNLIFNYSLF